VDLGFHRGLNEQRESLSSSTILPVSMILPKVLVGSSKGLNGQKVSLGCSSTMLVVTSAMVEQLEFTEETSSFSR